MLIWNEVGAKTPDEGKEVLCQGSNGGVFFGKLARPETEYVHGATVALFYPTHMKNESQRGSRYAERWCDVEYPVEQSVVEKVVEREKVVHSGVELTPGMCENVAEFIELYLFHAIRDDEDIDNFAWLHDMVAAQKIMSEYAHDGHKEG